jgi:addiction module RelE/StbE family toxin
LTYRLVITEPAERDLREIANYIANELLETETARKVIARITEAVLQLEEMPFRNGLVGDERLAKQGIRKFLADSYIVFYVASEAEKIVTIIRILYGKRHWNSLL